MKNQKKTGKATLKIASGLLFFFMDLNHLLFFARARFTAFWFTGLRLLVIGYWLLVIG